MRYVLILACVLVSVCSRTVPPQVERHTINAIDPSTGTMISPVNIFETYQPRGRVVGQVRHGDTVSLLKRDGQGCQVETTTRVKGWLNCAFLR